MTNAFMQQVVTSVNGRTSAQNKRVAMLDSFVVDHDYSTHNQTATQNRVSVGQNGAVVDDLTPLLANVFERSDIKQQIRKEKF